MSRVCCLAALVLFTVASVAAVIEELELGIYDYNSAETTPILWYGELMLVEGRLDSASPNDPHIHVGGEPLLANGSSHFRVRKHALLGHGTNDVVVPLIPDTVMIQFCNAHVQYTGPGGELGNQTLWVFGTNSDARWGAPARTQVHAFWSSDPTLQVWNHTIVLQLPTTYQAFNTDVTVGPGGYAFMAIELGAPSTIVGVPFTSVFAKTTSADLSTGWTLLDPTKHVYTTSRYSACPTLRWFNDDQYFYMTTLFGGVPNATNTNTGNTDNANTNANTTHTHTNTNTNTNNNTHFKHGQHNEGALPGSTGYACCFVTWLVRSKDLIEWEVAPQNPLLGWPDWSDRVITPGSILDNNGSIAQKKIGTSQNYSDINRSDQDMVELPESFVAQLPGERVPSGPWTFLIYIAGDQLTTGFGGSMIAKASMFDYLSGMFN